MATHHSPPPQSLPSFAQAFSSSSLNNIHGGSNALPPIQARHSFERFNRNHSPNSRDNSRNASLERALPPPPSHKRSREEEEASGSHSGSEHTSPRTVRVKEEEDHDMLDASPPPPAPVSRLVHPRPSIDMGSTSSPMPGFLGPPSKKRRTTVSGGPHALNTNLRRAPSQDPNGGNTTPISPSVISPAVMGFTIGRDDPAAIEQVRSMLTVKQKQKALIEQRRGSVAGIVGMQPNHANLLAEQRRGSVAGILTVAPSGNSPRAPGVTRLSAGIMPNQPTEDRPAKATTSARNARRSPKTGSNSTRRAPPADLRPPTPTPMALPVAPPVTQAPAPAQPAQPPPSIESTANQLPPPPISFARRRAAQLGPGAAKAKPSDIVISPRESHAPNQLVPLIQSAPPIPQGQNGGGNNRFPSMMIPRLPSVMDDGNQVQRVTSGRVPPTPTRLTMQGSAANSNASHAGSGPGIASVPISTSLVPPTPTSLQRPGYSGDKSAFLAPFEVFYDALNDAKQMKGWLADQLQKSQTLMQSLRHQQENMEDMIERAVERRMRGVRDEITNLHTRVEELEGALRLARSEEQMEMAISRRSSIDPFAKGKISRVPSSRVNGFPPTPDPPAVGYQFPPPQDPPPPPSIARSPSIRRPEVERRVSSPGWGHDAGPSHSVSASRYEPPRPQPQAQGQPPSPSVASRRIPTPVGGKNSPQQPPAQRPHRLRSSSSAADINGMAGVEATGPPSAPTGRRRRDSVAMSPPADTRRSHPEDA